MLNEELTNLKEEIYESIPDGFKKIPIIHEIIDEYVNMHLQSYYYEYTDEFYIKLSRQRDFELRTVKSKKEKKEIEERYLKIDFDYCNNTLNEWMKWEKDFWKNANESEIFKILFDDQNFDELKFLYTISCQERIGKYGSIDTTIEFFAKKIYELLDCLNQVKIQNQKTAKRMVKETIHNFEIICEKTHEETEFILKNYWNADVIEI